jgi:TolB-like protein/DNA-binding SARP family transcriptional activator
MNTASALGNEGRARWSLRLFGGFELSLLPGGERVTSPGKRERVLLAYLALNPKGREQRRNLTTLLWGDAADETTLENLRNCLYGLRKTLGDSEHRVIASDGEDIVLDASAFEVDALAFRRLAAQSGRAELEEAAKLCSGGLLDGLNIESEEFESWRRSEATRCRDQAVDVLNRLMAQLAASGESEHAIEAGLRILRLEPLHEATVRSLMRLYSESGRRVTAVELYRTHVDALRKELDIQPEAETRAVYTEITRGSEGQTVAVAETKSLPPPAIAAQANGTVDALSPAEPFDTPASIGRQKAKRRTIGWFAAGGLAAAAIAFLLLPPFAPSTGPTPTGAPTAVVGATPTSAIALAVLPLANLSSDPEQEFFSDGLTEEIGSALARIPDLGIVARTSAFEFKGQNRDIRTIGEQLGATHLIEGSVRKAGDRVRIAVQLIRVGDGTRIWSDDYDRQLTDIFAIQEDIAAAIADALKMPLGLAPGQTLVSLRPKDEETYELFLRGRAAYRARRAEEAMRFLEQAVARDPNFAPSWRYLSQARNFDRLDRGRRGEEPKTYPESGETLARRVIALAPGSPDGYAMLATLAGGEGKILEAMDLAKQALARDPDDVEVMNGIANNLWDLGYLKEALAVRERQHLLEPLIPVYNSLRVTTMAANGMVDEAVRDWMAVRPNVTAGSLLLLNAYAQLGRFSDAIDILQSGRFTPEGLPAQPLPQAQVDAAVQVLRAAANKTAPPARLPDFEGELAFLYAYTSTPERMLDRFESDVKGGLPTALRFVWWPVPSSVRKTERFKTLMRNAGFVDIWRVRGWPDHCRPVGTNDFACD